MPVSLKNVEADARSLSSEDRASLVQAILESLHPMDPAVEKEWSAEIERRVDAFDRGELATYSAENVIAEARRSTK
ncbi:MAG: addiction module protein [Trueperaceae bacterium]|nr:addiction module protein [Trueperaceae bacterium]MCW5819102.1 addiction module protein [Trueperaceae bacterium]